MSSVTLATKYYALVEIHAFLDEINSMPIIKERTLGIVDVEYASDETHVTFIYNGFLLRDSSGDIVRMMFDKDMYYPKYQRDVLMGLLARVHETTPWYKA